MGNSPEGNKPINEHSVSSIYDRYLTPSQLEGQPLRATIGMANLETDKGFNGDTVTRIVCTFAGRNAPKPFKLNKTQAVAIGKIAGSDDYREWSGTEIVMVEGMTQQNKPTIVITAPPRPTTKPTRQQEAAQVQGDGENGNQDDVPF